MRLWPQWFHCARLMRAVPFLTSYSLMYSHAVVQSRSICCAGRGCEHPANPYLEPLRESTGYNAKEVETTTDQASKS
jgi:hypothetical protein